MKTVLEEHLRALAGELRGARRDDRVRASLEEAMRIQAVIVRDAESAVACLRGFLPEALVEELEPLARELFLGHRARMAAIRAGEVERAAFVARRAGERGR